ncbi:hypothetical protein [Magnetospirillum gryphiswaldense]|uniref:hypothetical protein n=1 Tax=Magnetospirillum gryphiswaldense TaxID=55518 RepID=UPI000D03EAC8|nr:hypothetical protein [Magnetospirillum gryphiswaldense]AVM76070.1 hypothetical protein MSR1_36090 [Magnetospirillum gryphiswaldense MSR-1]AVM79973.1 hypothetical protein MSR1L_36090 [Magnetospirillum gryphiswaldense]
MLVRCATPYLQQTEDEALHGRLYSAVDTGKVVLLVNEIRLNAPGSPAYSGLDGLLTILVPIVGFVATWWSFGWLVGLASALPWAAVFLVAGRLVLGRVNGRACRFALMSDAHFDELWRWGGLRLRTADGAATAREGDDWRAFARTWC